MDELHLYLDGYISGIARQIRELREESERRTERAEAKTLLLRSGRRGLPTYPFEDEQLSDSDTAALYRARECE